MERWAEHYQEPCSKVNVGTDRALANTIDELRKAINSLSCGKGPGSDGILRREVEKAGVNNSLIGHLHELLLQCWEEGTIAQDMQDAKIVTLYKNKCDRSNCNNYRGISLLSIVGKAFI